MSRINLTCKCTRCRHTHMESERTWGPHKSDPEIKEALCPRCGCKSYFDMTPSVAWCWATGLIEIGDAVPVGAIKIAKGPMVELKVAVDVVARHGQRQSNGKLLVPGIPEATTDQARSDALDAWLDWCAKGNGKKYRKGVVFMTEAHGVTS